jgi:hypothetical protein
MTFGKLVMALIAAWIVIQCLPFIVTVGLMVLLRILGIPIK